MIAAATVWALELDAGRDGLGEILDAVAGGEAVEVRVRHVAAARGGLARRLAQAGDAGRGERPERRAVVGDLPRAMNFVLFGVAGELVVLPDDLQGSIDGLAAAGSGRRRG